MLPHNEEGGVLLVLWLGPGITDDDETTIKGQEQPSVSNITPCQNKQLNENFSDQILKISGLCIQVANTAIRIKIFLTI